MPFCLRLTSRSFTLAGPITVSRQPIAPPHFRFTRVVAAGSDMAASTVRVAAAQMTSVNDLAANFATCSLLVKRERAEEKAKEVGKDADGIGVPLLLTGNITVALLSVQRDVCNTSKFSGSVIYGQTTQEAALAGAKLLCFPESFSYVGAKDGDSVKIAEPLDGPIMQKYCSLARESSIWLSLGGFQEKGPDDEHLCNTHVVIDDAGNIRSTYRKIHLFDVNVPGGREYKESSFTEAGRDIVAVDSPIGRLGLTVCYDLRFPELYQQLRFQHDVQVLLVPAAFTKVTGQAHWEILLRARAIETQCYVVAATQAGMNNDKRESYGDSIIIDPWGTVVGRLPDRLSTGIAVAEIDFSLIDSVRAKMPIAMQRKPIDFWKSASQ